MLNGFHFKNNKQVDGTLFLVFICIAFLFYLFHIFNSSDRDSAVELALLDTFQHLFAGLAGYLWASRDNNNNDNGKPA